MKGRNGVGFTAGLALATGGLVAYVSSAGADDGAWPSETAATSQDSRTAAIPGEQMVVAPRVLGLSESVTRVLRAEGFLGWDQGVTLPPSVRRVLAEYDAVLTVEGLR